jgi:hypothetical protein
MNPATRIAAFVAMLVVIFGGAALAGAALDPEGGDDSPHAEAPADAGHGDPHAGSGSGSTTGSAGGAAAPGLASSQDGLRLVADRTHFTADLAMPLRFRIVDDDGDTVRDFELEQARRMHLIVVRRDLRRYQHLHPVQGADGEWAIDLTLPEAGVYRAFADFRIDGEQHTLGVDLFAPGDFRPLDLPREQRTAQTDGYDVQLLPRDESVLYFTIVRGTQTVVPQPYLGAKGHLVVLREGDLAYRHVHPVQRGLGFEIGDPEPGTYRLFLQFRHAGTVHTAAFTRVVEG